MELFIWMNRLSWYWKWNILKLRILVSEVLLPAGTPNIHPIRFESKTSEEDCKAVMWTKVSSGAFEIDAESCHKILTSTSHRERTSNICQMVAQLIAKLCAHKNWIQQFWKHCLRVAYFTWIKTQEFVQLVLMKYWHGSWQGCKCIGTKWRHY